MTLKEVDPSLNARALYRVEERLATILDIAGQNNSYTYQALGSTFILPEERKFTNLEQIQTYVDDFMLTDEARGMGDGSFVKITVKESKRDNQASYGNNGIRIPDNSEYRRELYVLHELAHHFGGSGHGERYLQSYCDLVSIQLNPSLALILRAFVYEERESYKNE